MADMKLFAGNATPDLAKKIADRLYTRLGNATVDRFSDGEIHVQINENVRGCDIFIIQSTCAPSNDNLMELIVMIDALRRASAGRITAVIPYFGYARQDRRLRSARVPITAKVVADFLSTVGVDRVLTVDLHAEQIQGFFDVPVDNCFSSQIFVDDMKTLNLKNPCVVSPDMGGVVRARAIAKLLDNADIAIIDKRRPRPNVSEVMHFFNLRLCDIVSDLERIFGIKVVLLDESLADTRYFAWFTNNETLEQILKGINADGKMNFTSRDGVIYISRR